MRKRLGLLGTLSAIAVGVAMQATGVATAVAQDTAALTEEGATPDLAVICAAILATTTRREFQGTPVALDAFNNAEDPCHDVALAHWERLLDPDVQTGAIGDGYGFV